MRYRLRTLLIGAALAPPLLAIAWFLLLILRVDSDLRNTIASHLAHVGLLTTLGLVAFSFFAFPLFTAERVTLPWGYVIALWCCQFSALWTWAWGLCFLLGWSLIWGDNPHPAENYLGPLSALVSASGATIIALRIRFGSVTGFYVVTVMSLTGLLALLTGLFWMLEI
jgi:hypothetical protein